MIEPFDDFDEIMNTLQRRMEEADSHVAPWQSKITAGQYFKRYCPLGFYIYGEILKEEEPREDHLKHYRLCKAYSIACLQGEMGDIHISKVNSLISKEEFDAVQKRGWK